MRTVLMRTLYFLAGFLRLKNSVSAITILQSYRPVVASVGGSLACKSLSFSTDDLLCLLVAGDR